MGADQHFDLRAQIASTLDWWRDAGVDVLVEEEPRDWLAPAVAEPASPAPPAPHAPALPNSVADYLTWRTGPDAIERRWGGAPLSPEGDPAAPIHIVVDSPDEAGGFVTGPAGRLFDRMLAAIGLDRSAVCISGLAWAPAPSITGEDADRLGELARHWLSLGGARRVLLLGQTTSRAIIGTDVARAGPVLHAINHQGRQWDAVAGRHPRFLLDHPAHKARAWVELQLLIRGLDL